METGSETGTGTGTTTDRLPVHDQRLAELIQPIVAVIGTPYSPEQATAYRYRLNGIALVAETFGYGDPDRFAHTAQGCFTEHAELHGPHEPDGPIASARWQALLEEKLAVSLRNLRTATPTA